MRWILCIGLLLPFPSPGQVPTAVLDTTVIRIGEQTDLLLTVDLQGIEPGTPIIPPRIADTLQRHVHVVQVSEWDTVRTSMPGGADIIQLVQRIRITSFDTGFWAIPPYLFTIGQVGAETRPLLLEVRGVDLGEVPELRDIKDIHEVPFSLASWVRRHWHWILLPLVAALLLWWLVAYWRRRPRPVVQENSTEPQQPLHERVLQRLHALQEERLWQNGEHKLYHSRLTDLLRGYIEERYNVPALERTTDELMQEMRVAPISADHRLMLRNMLELSDMVKFAKATPSPAENEMMMANAIVFVKETAPAPAMAHA